MKIEVKGHSGCRIDVVQEGDGIYVYKSTADPKYLKRLVLQAEKQQNAGQKEYRHIRVPKIYGITQGDGSVTVKMEYVYSRNFIEFFEQAGFEQIGYLVDALRSFVEHEIGQCNMERVGPGVFLDKFADIRKKCRGNALYGGDPEIEGLLEACGQVFASQGDMLIPVGLCHGDLTFSNILFNGSNCYLIDFLDSFVETPLQDIVKIRQDTRHLWSQLMYTKPFDRLRLQIVCRKMDDGIDGYFRDKYGWYGKHYNVMQLMNMLRILPYAKEQRVVDYLTEELNKILHETV